jgi:selenocysteine-specific elongation factor
MGHIDSGKTAIARALSELVSTAGLDKHSQAQQRGITIDLGFTFFPLENYMITLVDAPGHADLIRSVVSGANIIDMAFIVIDGTKGPQVQTGEHLVVLHTLGIPKIFILINKIDMIDEKSVVELSKQIRSICRNTRFGEDVEIFPVSALKNQGFAAVKTALITYLQHYQPTRNPEAPFKFPFDHHFAKKGQGTVLTGTVLRGRAQVGDSIIILPQNIKTKIKSIQHWKQAVNSTEAGDRVGISVTEVNPEEIYRGCIAVQNPERYIKSQIVQLDVELINLYQKPTRFGQQITVNHGMQSITGWLYPYTEEIINGEKCRLAIDLNVDQKKFLAILWLETPEYVEIGDILLVMRLDLPPTTLRIMGKATINHTLIEPIIFHRIRTKQGKVKTPHYTKNSVIVEGLTESVEGARTMVGLQAEPPFAKILGTFGGKGHLEVEVQPGKIDQIEKDQLVELRLIKKYPVKRD